MQDLAYVLTGTIRPPEKEWTGAQVLRAPGHGGVPAKKNLTARDASRGGARKENRSNDRNLVR